MQYKYFGSKLELKKHQYQFLIQLTNDQLNIFNSQMIVLGAVYNYTINQFNQALEIWYRYKAFPNEFNYMLYTSIYDTIPDENQLYNNLIENSDIKLTDFSPDRLIASDIYASHTHKDYIKYPIKRAIEECKISAKATIPYRLLNLNIENGCDALYFDNQSTIFHKSSIDLPIIGKLSLENIISNDDKADLPIIFSINHKINYIGALYHPLVRDPNIFYLNINIPYEEDLVKINPKFKKG